MWVGCGGGEVVERGWRGVAGDGGVSMRKTVSGRTPHAEAVNVTPLGRILKMTRVGDKGAGIRG